jgi:chromosome segregation ATPase
MPVSDCHDALHIALTPVKSLQDDYQQIQQWVQESFAAVESLQVELTQWQTELDAQRQQIEERQDEQQQQQTQGDDRERQIAELEAALATSRQEVALLEADSAEQLQALDALERKHIAVCAELEAVRQQASHLLEQQTAAAHERQEWLAELAELRQLMTLLAELSSASSLVGDASSASPEELLGDAATDSGQAAQLKARAQQRRAERLGKQ